jgi:hypothetical protein
MRHKNKYLPRVISVAHGICVTEAENGAPAYVPMLRCLEFSAPVADNCLAHQDKD